MRGCLCSQSESHLVVWDAGHQFHLLFNLDSGLDWSCPACQSIHNVHGFVCCHEGRTGRTVQARLTVCGKKVWLVW